MEWGLLVGGITLAMTAVVSGYALGIDQIIADRAERLKKARKESRYLKKHPEIAAVRRAKVELEDLYKWKKDRRLQERNEWMDLYALALMEMPGGTTWERQPIPLYDDMGRTTANGYIERVEYQVRTRQRDLEAKREWVRKLEASADAAGLYIKKTYY